MSLSVRPLLPVAILAGGLATRLMPLSQRVPKALIEVAGKPFVEHQLELLRRYGCKRVVLCVGYLGERIQAALGDGCRFGLTLQYSFDGPKLMGTGGAIRKALPLLGDAFLVLYGDTYLQCDYAAVARTFLASDKLGLMTVLRGDRYCPDQWNRNNVLFEEGCIRRYEKRNPTPNMRHIDYGLSAFRSRTFEQYPPDEPLDLSTVQHDLAEQGQLIGFEVTERFYEIGSPEALIKTRRYFESLRKPRGSD